MLSVETTSSSSPLTLADFFEQCFDRRHRYKPLQFAEQVPLHGLSTGRGSGRNLPSRTSLGTFLIVILTGMTAQFY